MIWIKTLNGTRIRLNEVMVIGIRDYDETGKHCDLTAYFDKGLEADILGDRCRGLLEKVMDEIDDILMKNYRNDGYFVVDIKDVLRKIGGTDYVD